MIYLDNAATSFPKPERVYKKMDEFYRKSGANPGRSGHKMAMSAAQAVETVRSELAGFFHAPGSERVIFTSNATEALNMAISGLLLPGDEAVTTVLDHNSLSRPLNLMAKERGVRITRALPRGEQVDPDEIRRMITKKTKIVALTHASNVTGWIQDALTIGKIVREHSDAYFLLDAAQSAGLIPVNMRESFIDILAVTGHKALYGPMGTGSLVISERVNLPPFKVGGSGYDSENEFHPEELPYKLEAGTENLPGIVGLGEGIQFILDRGMDNIRAEENRLRMILLEGLEDLNGIKIYTSANAGEGLGLLSLTFDKMPPSDAAMILDGEFGIAVRPGLQCAPYMHKFLGTFPKGSVRISIGCFNTEEEITRTIEAIRQVI
jgi:cysteine desulfurase family protein